MASMVDCAVLVAPRTGLRLKNPVMAASGTFGYGIEFAERMDVSGLGAIVCKGTTREPRTGNPPLRMVETPAGMLNAIGLANVGVDGVIAEKAPRWESLPTPVLVNISGESIDDFEYLAGRLDGIPGIAGLEVNISCPNVRRGGLLFGADADMAREVTAAVRAVTALPLIVKLTPNVADIRPIAAAVEQAGADAVTVGNTLFGMAIDVRRRAPVLAGITGGLSGPAVKPHALYLVYQVAQVVSVPMIGAGGILTATDALEFIMAGATAVQLGTALLVDPAAWQAIAAEIDRWCRREGVQSVRDIVGAANPGYKRGAGEATLTGS